MKPFSRSGSSIRVVSGLRLLAMLILAFCCENLFASREALVIGNSRYQHLHFLSNPIRDAELIARDLTAVNFYVTKLTDLNNNDMKKALGDFCKKIAKGDVAIIYYSGHGFQYNEQSRLLPVDYDPAAVKFDFEVRDKTLSLEDVLNALSSAQAKPKIVILDACRNLVFLRIPMASRHQGWQTSKRRTTRL
jgi:uncharacterized caspase-like protein